MSSPPGGEHFGRLLPVAGTAAAAVYALKPA